MAIKQYRPTTPGRRGMTSQDLDAVTTKKPVKSLVKVKKKFSGRNNQGRITTRHKGGGTRKFYRVVSFDLPAGIEATVEHIEYDPNRTARLARLKDTSGKYHYVIATSKMKSGDKIVSGEGASIEEGSRLPLKNIPTGSLVHSIELQPGKGGQIARSAGANAQVTAKEGNYAYLKMPSGEVRMININCTASIGTVGNIQHQNIKYGKAGRKRNMGIRPTVRGTTMNAADHPHGGGDGGAHGTGKDPRTPWGQKTLGHKTRRRKQSNKYIVRSKHQSKRK